MTLCLTLLVVPYNLLPQLRTVHPRFELGAHEECSAQLPVETVRLLWGRGESVGEHDRYERSDGRRDGLLGESVGTLVMERTWGSVLYPSRLYDMREGRLTSY